MNTLKLFFLSVLESLEFGWQVIRYALVFVSAFFRQRASLGCDKAALSLCAARLCKLVLAEVVRDEVEENLLLHAERLPPLEADELIEHYRRLVKLTDPEMVPYPAATLVRSSRHLIRHAADVPVLLSAMASRPDWLLTYNTKHFTQAVAKRAGLRIATPAEFFRTLSSLLR